MATKISKNGNGLGPGALTFEQRETTGETVPVYFTPAEVAEVLQVDEKTVLRWSLQDASMPVLRRGRVVRFHRERLMLWLERQEPRARGKWRKKDGTSDETPESTAPSFVSPTAPGPPSVRPRGVLRL